MSIAGLGAVLVLLPLFSWAAKPSQIEIRADPRIELFAALHALTAAGEETDGFHWNKTPYSELLRRRVEPFRSHQAAVLYRGAYERALREGWGYMGVLNAAFPCLEESLSFSSDAACAKNALAREAADFAKKAGLESFPEGRKALSFYESELEAQRAGLDPAGAFAAFTGLKTLAPQRISPSPLFSPGQVWNHLEPAAAGRPALILTVVSPKFNGEKIEFDFSPLVWDVWHEQSHARLDAELEAYPERVERLRPLFEPLAAACYQSWRQCLREHLAQGIARGVGEWAAATGRLSPPPLPLKESLPYLRAAADRLKEFQEQRSRYPTIREFYPRLLDVFETLRASTAAAPAPPSASGKGRNLKDSGMAHFQGGRLDRALLDFTAAAELDERDSEARLDLGVVLIELGRLEEALKSLDGAVRTARERGSPSDSLLADALSSRASLENRLGRFLLARKDCEEALKAAPDDWGRSDEVHALLKSLPP